jgi:hypothetical protein
VYGAKRGLEKIVPLGSGTKKGANPKTDALSSAHPGASGINHVDAQGMKTPDV